ncbi:MAG TPA: hypothetical protein IAA17_03485 [Candidatus Lachnoclostridium stercorigallinarum]|uniref:Uncharacterized protein n=1 Tax=Candidatus Lachnoclostridium stercorigallinarum TaxID=2838634 RepID=A0A9D2GH60_9FIRM|nr:hypothetical protein [Candidatus Lachnoclostridium stercorigallinarum]
MKRIGFIKKCFANICVIAGAVTIAVQILDWYNPYMNFSGYLWPVPWVFLVCSLVLAGLEIFS